jgi:ligand-binding sensor domain-containing protein
MTWKNQCIAAFVFVCLFSTSEMAAQEPFFRISSLPEKYKDCQITAMMQDSCGMIWVGTSCGVLKFDGFDVEKPATDTGDFNQPVSALFQDFTGKIWVGFKSGKVAFVQKNQIEFFSRITENNVPVTGITTNLSGNYLFSTYGNGIYAIMGDSAVNIGKTDGLSDLFVYTLVADKEGKIWAGSDAGIDVLTFSESKPTVRHLGFENGLPDIMVQKLEVDDEGIIWAGTHDNGFCRIASKTLEVSTFGNVESWNSGPVTGIIPGKENVWISTHGHGLIKVGMNPENDPKSFGSFGRESFLKTDGIFRDKEGNIWSFTSNRIILIPGDLFEFVSGDENNGLNNVHALMTDSENFLWYASENGIFRHSPDFSDKEKSEKISLPPGISSRDITCLYQDTFGFVWIGTFGQGLYRINPDLLGGRFYTEKNGLVNNNILSISSNDQEIWFATLGGASRCKTDGAANVENPVFENFDESEGLGNNFIYCVYTDKQGRVWFATDGKGITRLSNEKFTTFGAEQGLLSSKIYSITADSKGVIWCATHDNSLYYFAGEKFIRLQTGLDAGSTISSIVFDKKDNLLIVHENGIYIFDSQDQTLLKYRAESGISPIKPEFNSTAVSSDGNIWIGNGDGLIRYTAPEKKTMTRPAIILKSVGVFLEPVDFAVKNKFPWDQNHLSFSYTGLWFHNPANVRYRVMLEGYDLDWNQTGDRRVNYSNLPGGKYIFRVSASQNDDFTNAAEVSFEFEIAHPFWQQWWFWLLIFALVAVSVYLVVKVRLNRIRKIEELKKEKIMFQFETLKSQVNPHFLFNSFGTLISIIDENPVLAIEYVEKLSVFFRNILEFRDKDLITLGEELEIIENYIFLQKKRFAENLRVQILVKPENQNSLIPPLTLQLLIENAIKHNVISQSKPLKIFVRSEAEGLIISNNLQKKPAMSDSTGFGLKTIQRRYELMGDYLVKIEEDGQTFSVILPLIQESSLKG